VHPGRFSTCHQARVDRNSRLEELRCHWDGEHSTLTVLVFMYKNKSTFNDGLVSRYHAAQTPLVKFVAAGPPELVRQVQNVKLTSSGP